MEPSSSSPSASRFRFRDHQPTLGCYASDGHTTPGASSVSSDADDDTDLQSMTAKGIKHLCSELLELKRESDEEFHKNIFVNSSVFVRIFEGVEGMKNELMQLDHHILRQKRLVKELIDSNSTYLEVLSKGTVESIIEKPTCVEPSAQSILKDHIENFIEDVDILLLEQRFDEAVEVLELEAGILRGIESQENLPSVDLTFYVSAISERKVLISDQLKQMAMNPRVTAPELQKALGGLCRVGEPNLATQLLLKYYHSRIASGILDLQSLKSANGAYIHEVAKFVFSMISQAIKSFLALYREKTTDSLELVQWACEEIELFSACFNKYARSISDISGRLITVVEAVQSALSYCSLLETQIMVLRPYLVKNIRPCVEEVLQIHIDHFKKVIGIFTSSDTWIVSRYCLPVILSKECSFVVIGQRPEYCLLTNSGRKFATLLQAIVEDISPLVAIQMEGPILRGLMDLFTDYISILESALTPKSNSLADGGPKVNLAESSEQKVSIIASLSTLVQLFSSTVKSIFKGINHLSFEVDSSVLYIQEVSDQLRANFCQQFIHRVICDSGCRLALEMWIGSERNFDTSDNVMPSIVFQELFLELRKLGKLVEDNFIEVDWFLKLMKELMETIFISISNNEEMWTIIKEDLAVQVSGYFKQFVLDMQFLVEIARQGGYFSDSIMNASLTLISRMESTFLSTGLDPKRDSIEEGWAVNAAKAALQKLQDIAEAKSSLNESTDDVELNTDEDDNHSGNDDAIRFPKPVVVNASEVLTTDADISKMEVALVNPTEPVITELAASGKHTRGT
ncbi:exocyst complex component EXO84B-like [Diospyros lotus]|uniref:exocyst complex component EXO84B-like n=1 Tax=Diospyros lotus TaxID=55363 RepID=UPI00224F75B4|nr:exocyst complex component EXO84B-like [Diospyros lotus]